MNTTAPRSSRRVRNAAQRAMAVAARNYAVPAGEPDHVSNYLAATINHERDTRTPGPKGSPMDTQAPEATEAPESVGLPETAATRAYLIAGVLAEYRREEAKAVELLWAGNAASALKVCDRARPLRNYLIREGVSL